MPLGSAPTCPASCSVRLIPAVYIICSYVHGCLPPSDRALQRSWLSDVRGLCVSLYRIPPNLPLYSTHPHLHFGPPESCTCTAPVMLELGRLLAPSPAPLSPPTSYPLAPSSLVLLCARSYQINLRVRRYTSIHHMLRGPGRCGPGRCVPYSRLGVIGVAFALLRIQSPLGPEG
jgi:hypothetical protein